MVMTTDNTYVICSNTNFEFSISFVKNQLFTSRDDAELALITFQKDIDEKKKEFETYGMTVEDRHLEIVTLEKFLTEFEETMFEAGRQC